MDAETPQRVFTDESAAPGTVIFARGTMGRNLTAALARCGVRAVLADENGASPCPLDTPEDGAAAMARASGILGAVDAMVYGWVDPAMAERQPLAAMPPEAWAEKCERPLLHCRNFFRLAHAALHARGGHVVMLLPSLAMTGAGDLVPWAAAAEGQRSLAKAVARGWGRHRIQVNCLAVPAAFLAGLTEDAGLERPGLPQPALAPALPAESRIASLLATLLTPGFASVTGTTIGADGGRWMTP